MQTALPIAFLLLTGVLLGTLSRWQRRHPPSLSWSLSIPENLSQSLTSFVLYVSLPALILLRIPSLKISSDVVIPVLMAWTMIGVSALLVIGAARVFGWDKNTRSLLLLLVPLGNTSFLGIPMVEAFFGIDKVPIALLYDQLGSFLGLAIYGAVVVALHTSDTSARSKTPVTSAVLQKIVAFPPFLALVAALTFFPADLHAGVRSILEMLGNTLVPIVMIAVGSRLQLDSVSKNRGPLVFGLSVKLVIAPLIALAACRMLGYDGDVADVSVFESGMPPMIAAWAAAEKAGLDAAGLGSVLVSLGILLSLATLPALFQLL